MTLYEINAMKIKVITIYTLILFNILFCLSLTFAQTQENQNAVNAENTFPVTLGEKTIFDIQSGVGIFTAKERANAINKRLEKIAKDPSFDDKKLGIINNESSTEIAFDDTTIVSISSQDIKGTNLSQEEMAKQYLAEIKHAIDDYKKAFSPKVILFGILYTILATVVFLVIMSFFNRFTGIIYRSIGKLEDKNIIKDVKFQKVRFLSAQKIVAVLKFLLILLQISFILILLVIYITTILGFFPWTASQSGEIYKNIYLVINHIITSIVFSLPNLLVILVIVTSAVFLIKFLKFIFQEIKQGTIHFDWFYKEWSDTTYNLLKFFIICLAIALIYPYLPGSDSNAFKGVSIFVGVLFSLGSTTAISNVVAGIILTYTRAFEVGERVKIADFTGDIIEKSTFVTRIKTTKNELISIPNSKVLSSEIVNYTDLAESIGLIINTQITIGYDAPWRDVHKCLINAANDTDNILKEKPPFVLQKALNDFYVSYEINAYTSRADLLPATYSSLYQNIQDKFNEAGIEILSPHYRAVRDGNHITIPNDYLPADYKPDSFNVKTDSGTI